MNYFGNNSGFGMNKTIGNSLDNLLGTCDPRDQLAHDIRMFQHNGVGNVRGMLETRLDQIDCRDQEAYDIRSTLNILPRW